MRCPVCVGKAAAAFQLPGRIALIEPHGDGLIHDTFVVHTLNRNGPERYILQRINQRVFTNPAALMENIERIVTHIQQRATRTGRNPLRAIPGLISTKTGSLLHVAERESWRMQQYVENTETIDCAPSVEQAYQIGLTFGRFADDLADIAPQSLQDVLPGYRDTERYLAALWQAVSDDQLNRAKDAREEIGFIEARAEQAMQLQRLQRSGQLPLRVIHGDTKLNNVLLDTESGDGVCAIDLDTVMPGLLLHDIGDCLREALVGVSKSATVLSQQDLRLVEAVISGFASSQSQPLIDLEWSSTVAAVRAMALELGSRFLCDYLSGDVYFRTIYPEQNLCRAQQQFRLQQRIEASESVLQSRIEQLMKDA